MEKENGRKEIVKGKAVWIVQASHQKEIELSLINVGQKGVEAPHSCGLARQDSHQGRLGARFNSCMGGRTKT